MNVITHAGSKVDVGGAVITGKRRLGVVFHMARNELFVIDTDGETAGLLSRYGAVEPQDGKRWHFHADARYPIGQIEAMIDKFAAQEVFEIPPVPAPAPAPAQKTLDVTGFVIGVALGSFVTAFCMWPWPK